MQGRQRLAAQAIIAAQFDDQHVGAVARELLGQSAQATGGGLAGNAGVDHLVWIACLGQPSL